MKEKSPENNDEYFEDFVATEESAAEVLKKLREKLKKCDAEKMEYLTGWQRAKADLINARKRDEADRADFMKFANERLIEELLPTLESFDLAMSNKDAWEKVDKNWRVGVEYIYSQLKKALSDAGLEEIDPIGKPYDHNRDEAAEYVPVGDKKDHHKVIAVVQKGYKFLGKDLRPPKVRVGEFKNEPNV